MGRTGDWVLDGFECRLEHVLHREAPDAIIQIKLELNFGENGIRLVLDGRGIDGKAGRRFLLFGTQDLEQGFDLFLGGPLVDDAPPGAVAFVHRPRPSIRTRHSQPV